MLAYNLCWITFHFLCSGKNALKIIKVISTANIAFIKYHLCSCWPNDHLMDRETHITFYSCGSPIKELKKEYGQTNQQTDVMTYRVYVKTAVSVRWNICFYRNTRGATATEYCHDLSCEEIFRNKRFLNSKLAVGRAKHPADINKKFRVYPWCHVCYVSS